MEMLVVISAYLLDDIEPSTWTSKIQELVDEKKVAIQPYTFEMTYDAWSYRTYGTIVDTSPMIILTMCS